MPGRRGETLRRGGDCGRKHTTRQHGTHGVDEANAGDNAQHDANLEHIVHVEVKLFVIEEGEAAG